MTGRVAAVLRAIYGWALRALPSRAADGLRGIVARWRHYFPSLEPATGDRIAVPGEPAHPVVLLIATGLPAERLARLRDHLAGTPARLVWLVDTDEPARLADQVIEWLPRRDDLGRAGMDPEAVHAARLLLVEQRYRPRRVVVLAGTDALPDPLFVSGPPR